MKFLLIFDIFILYFEIFIPLYSFHKFLQIVFILQGPTIVFDGSFQFFKESLKPLRISLEAFTGPPDTLLGPLELGGPVTSLRVLPPVTGPDCQWTRQLSKLLKQIPARTFPYISKTMYNLYKSPLKKSYAASFSDHPFSNRLGSFHYISLSNKNKLLDFYRGA